MEWTNGPEGHGYVYHKRGVAPLGADAVMVDVFINPAIARQRPVAITVGRYRHDKPMRTEQWQLQGASDLSPVARELPPILARVGAKPEQVPQLTKEIEEFLRREEQTISGILASLWPS